MTEAALGSRQAQMLRHLFESELCSVFVARPSALRAGLPDVMEYWTLREYVESTLLRAAPNSARRQSLQAERLCIFDQETLEACAFAFGSMDGDTDSLRGVNSEKLCSGRGPCPIHTQETWIAASPGRGSMTSARA